MSTISKTDLKWSLTICWAAGLFVMLNSAVLQAQRQIYSCSSWSNVFGSHPSAVYDLYERGIGLLVLSQVIDQAPFQIFVWSSMAVTLASIPKIFKSQFTTCIDGLRLLGLAMIFGLLCAWLLTVVEMRVHHLSRFWIDFISLWFSKSGLTVPLFVGIIWFYEINSVLSRRLPKHWYLSSLVISGVLAAFCIPCGLMCISTTIGNVCPEFFDYLFTKATFLHAFNMDPGLQFCLYGAVLGYLSKGLKQSLVNIYGGQASRRA